jgi:hypothetical protein
MGAVEVEIEEEREMLNHPQNDAHEKCGEPAAVLFVNNRI